MQSHWSERNADANVSTGLWRHLWSSVLCFFQEWPRWGQSSLTITYLAPFWDRQTFISCPLINPTSSFHKHHTLFRQVAIITQQHYCLLLILQKEMNAELCIYNATCFSSIFIMVPLHSEGVLRVPWYPISGKRAFYQYCKQSDLILLSIWVIWLLFKSRKSGAMLTPLCSLR